MDYMFNHLCQGKRMVTDESIQGLCVRDLIDAFLQVSISTFNYLKELPEDKFNELPENNKNNVETVSELIQRVALHFLGHTGQIIWIKKHIGKGGAFVMGVKKKQRDDSRIKWLKWWNENKEKYNV
jgi:hypothetical protein